MLYTYMFYSDLYQLYLNQTGGGEFKKEPPMVSMWLSAASPAHSREMQRSSVPAQVGRLGSYSRVLVSSNVPYILLAHRCISHILLDSTKLGNSLHNWKYNLLRSHTTL